MEANDLRQQLLQVTPKFTSEKLQLESDKNELEKCLQQNMQELEHLQLVHLEQVKAIHESFKEQLDARSWALKSLQELVEKKKEEFDCFRTAVETNDRNLQDQILCGQLAIAEKNRECEKLKKELADKEAQHKEMLHKIRMKV